MRCFAIQSNDDGLTWTSPAEITEAFEPFRAKIDWQVIATGPGHGVQLRSGRLIAPFWMTDYERRLPWTKGTGIIYSDDDGRHWQAGEIAIPRGGEVNVAELPDGSVIVTARNTDPRDREIRLGLVAKTGLWRSRCEGLNLLEFHHMPSGNATS